LQRPYYRINTLKSVSKPGLAVAIVAAILFWIHALTSESGFLILDYINLPFHEFGHLFFGVLGERVGIWGGTIAQLAIPLIILVAFNQKKEALGVAFSAFWIGENLLNIALYIGDAQMMELPLVGGGEHDWNTILSGLHALKRTAMIAGIVKVSGWIVMIGAMFWLIAVALLAEPRDD
jgi:hypothetical protein